MRKAVGIILIIWGILGLIGLVLNLTDSGIYLSLVFVILWRIGSGALLVTGGFFCLKKRYWGVCLASALLALSIGVFSAIDVLRYVPHRTGQFWVGGISLTWGTGSMLLGAVLSTIFISITKREWKGNQGLPDSSTSQHLGG